MSDDEAKPPVGIASLSDVCMVCGGCGRRLCSLAAFAQLQDGPGSDETCPDCGGWSFIVERE